MENPTNTNAPSKPNIILITVDQMRFPMNFPKNKGINTPDNFISKYMPKLYQYLWNPGVKFSNYYTAASDCTAARATIHTGLYGYQTYSMLTLITYPPKMTLQPELNSAFPTIGKLMRPEYDTPYFGKWHLSYNADELKNMAITATQNLMIWLVMRDREWKPMVKLQCAPQIGSSTRKETRSGLSS